jgi:transposase
VWSVAGGCVPWEKMFPKHWSTYRHASIRQVRPKLGCASCERIVQAAAPSRPIERDLAGPGLLAHVLVA